MVFMCQPIARALEAGCAPKLDKAMMKNVQTIKMKDQSRMQKQDV